MQSKPGVFHNNKIDNQIYLREFDSGGAQQCHSEQSYSMLFFRINTSKK